MSLTQDDQNVKVPLLVCCLNIQSLRIICCFDKLALTDRWHGVDTDQLNVNELVPAGYEFNHLPCKSGKCGGCVGILY